MRLSRLDGRCSASCYYNYDRDHSCGFMPCQTKIICCVVVFINCHQRILIEASVQNATYASIANHSLTCRYGIYAAAQSDVSLRPFNACHFIVQQP